MIAFVFPGQGSQQPQMGAPFVDDPAWEIALRAREFTGVDVPALLLDAEDGRLRETQNAQVVVATHALMSLRVARRLGIRVDAVAGHSVGEFAALVVAGVLAEDDALRLVAARGAAMGAACGSPLGGMIAVRAGRATAERLVKAAAPGVWLAAVNAPGQMVVGGGAAALDGFEAVAHEAGVRCRRLRVAGAFHTPLMDPARDAFEQVLGSTALADAAKVPVALNADGELRRAGDWRGLLLEQLTSPVMWQKCVESLADAGATTFIEFGATATLGALTRRAVSGAVCMHACSPAEIEALHSPSELRLSVDVR